MDVGAASAILASIVSLTVAIAIWLRRPRRAVYFRFGLFCVSLFLWHGATVANRFSSGLLVFLKIQAGILIPITTLFFFRELLRVSPGFETLSRWLLAGAVLGTALNVSPLGGSLFSNALLTVYAVGGFGLVLWDLYKRTQRAATEAVRRRVRLLFYGGLLVLLLSLGEVVPGVEGAAAFGHVASTFYIYFLYQSIIARRLIDLVEMLGKAAVVASLTLLLASVYALLVLWVGRGQQGLWLFNTLVASFVILILYDQVRPWVEQNTLRLLFRQGYELKQRLRSLPRRLRSAITIEEMVQRILDGVDGAGPVTRAAVYLQSETQGRFRLIGFRGAEPPKVIHTTNHPALLGELRRERRPLLLESLLARAEEIPALVEATDPTWQHEQTRIDDTVASMRTLGASLIMPMVVDERLVGLLCLGTEPVTEAFSSEDVAALIFVAESSATVIETSHEYEKRRERDRLVVVGEMATGMAHEIRNPLGAIKGAAQCLDPAALPVEARELVDVIIEETDRLNHVVAQFLEYARPYRGDPKPTQVNDIVTGTLRLLANQPEMAKVTVERNLGLDLPQVSVDAEQLKQVLINLLKNAVEAMEGKGSIMVSTVLENLHRPSPGVSMHEQPPMAEVVIRVTDEGLGIKPEDLQHIFVPFYTTKSQGTGLGLAISQRIVQNAGGRMEVASSEQGTTFAVRLPALLEMTSP